MAQAQANGLTLEYETFGRPGAPAILLIMGLGAQLTLWPESFCRRLAQAGYFVIRYDNRDVGLSSKLDPLGRPPLARATLAYRLGLPVRAPYTLDDMADDAVGLLDALGIARAHVVGASMGGMIAQLLGARHRDRVHSLVLVMTSSGDRRLPGPSLKVGLRLVRRPRSRERETLIAHTLETSRLIASPGFPLSERERRDKVERHFDRAYHPPGLARQTLAIFASRDRTALLPAIAAPTLVVHGRDDVLVPVAAGFDLAERIRGARLKVIDGMGHDFPEPLVPRISELVLDHVGRAAPGHAGQPRAPKLRPRPRREIRAA